MRAQLIESPGEHHWVLLDHRVTQLAFDADSLRLHTWALDGSTELRVAAPFTLRSAAGGGRALDPAETPSLAPVLALLRRRMSALTITRAGELTAEFEGGVAIVVEPSSRRDAWELQGGGALEGVVYRCPAGGGVPWEVS